MNLVNNEKEQKQNQKVVEKQYDQIASYEEKTKLLEAQLIKSKQKVGDIMNTIIESGNMDMMDKIENIR